ncbi:hypothetical protein ACLB1R_15305 [Escherichia coli]
MGVGMLTRFLGRNDTERRIMINSSSHHTGPATRFGLLPAGGALFAAWPTGPYAAAFSWLLCGDDPRAGVFVLPVRRF